VSDLDVAILCFVTIMYTKIYWGQQGCEPDCPAPEIQTLVEVQENTYALLIQGSVVSTRLGLFRLHSTSAKAAVHGVATSL